MQARETLGADHFVEVAFLNELEEGRLTNATWQAKHQVQGDFFWMVKSECGHPLAVHSQESDAAGWAGCPPCLETGH